MGQARLSHFLRCLAAAAYDALVLGGVVIASSFAIIIFRGGAAMPVGHVLFQIFIVLQVAVYFAGFWICGGQTPGMRAWSLRVTTSQGRPLTVNIALRRLLAAILAWLPLGIGMLWMLVDQDGRSWHDRLSGTVVRREPSQA